MAKFSQDGKEILGVGSRQVFYVYDIGSGKVSRIDTKGESLPYVYSQKGPA